ILAKPVGNIFFVALPPLRLRPPTSNDLFGFNDYANKKEIRQ
ncbi:hypothetical protein HMPREF3034_02581, partial [Prevotella sp. DNF00663]